MADQSSGIAPAKYLKVLSTAPAVAKYIGSRSPWLAFGWEYVESGGDVSNLDTSVPSLGGEAGLYQLSQDERNATGFTDLQRMLSDVDYSVQAGMALIDYYGGKVQAAGVTPDNEPVYSYLIKLAHGGGAGFMRSLVSDYITANGGQPPDIATFEQWATDSPYQGKATYTQNWLDNADRVRVNGMAIAALANLPSPGIDPRGLALLLALGGLITAAVWRAQS